MKRATPPLWYPDERALAGPEHLEAGFVAGYDRKAGDSAAEDAAELPRLGLPRGATVVDLGAGTGAFALAAATLGFRVIAVDVSETMLREAARKAEGRGIEFVQAGMLTYEHRGEPAHFVYARNVLHHLPDFWKAMALRRMASVLRPSGLLRLRDIVFSFDPAEAKRAIDRWMAAAPERPEGGWTRAELEVHLRTEYSTFTWLLEPMLERCGFTIREARYSETRTFADYLCERAPRSGTGRPEYRHRRSKARLRT
jgi:ubiquinone/menaquinone biosynthesis C-methylase UbiE